MMIADSGEHKNFSVAEIEEEKVENSRYPYGARTCLKHTNDHFRHFDMCTLRFGSFHF